MTGDRTCVASPRGDGGIASSSGSGAAGVSGASAVGGPSGSDVGASDNALTIHVEDIDGMTIEIITLACAGDCAEVEAVARGGNPPYAFEWEDGSTVASRHVCLEESEELSVSATDTGAATEEFEYEPHTVTTMLTATVLDCADGGMAADAGDPALSVYWTTWTAMTTGSPGSAAGFTSPPGGDVSVAYTGESIVPSAITGQPSTLLIGVATFTPESTYLSNTVTNGPPPSGMIAIAGSAMLTQTITFSAPVRDPLVAVMSLGNFGMASTWSFDAAPVVLSSGPGIALQNGTLTASGTELTGAEGNGVVQFSGTFTTLNFTVPWPEGNAQFTVGIRGRE